MQKLLKSKLKDKKGFTLVEILVVLAIMAILIAIAVPVMAGALNDAKEKVVLADARAAYIAFELKRADKENVTDVSLEDILSYIDKSKAADIKIGYTLKADSTAVDTFYYQAPPLKDKRYVVIKMGTNGSIDTVEDVTGVTFLSNP